MDQRHIIWKSTYEVGVQGIDDQHKKLFAMLDNLTRPDPEVRLGDLVLALGRYIDEHFAYEEGLMLSHGYPKRDEHVAQHDDLKGQYRAMTAGQHSTDPEAVARVRMVVYTWFSMHILGDRMDRDLGMFLQRIGVFLR